MTASGSNIDFYLKTVYDDEGVKDLENMEPLTWNMLQTSSKKIGGLGFQFPVKTQGNQANLGATNENENNPTGGNQVGTDGLITPKIVKQAVRMSGLAIEKAKNTGEEAYAETITYQLDAGIRDHVKELNQESFRSGTGIIAVVNGAVSASTSVVFDNGIATHFRIGMKLAFYNSSTLEATNRQVSDVDLSTNTITLDSTVTLTDNDNIYRYIDGVGDTKTDAPAGGKELSGLPLLTDDGTITTTYENINRSTNPAFQGITLDFNSANLSDDALQRGIARVKVISGFNHGPGKSLIVSSTGQFRKYMSILTPAREYVVMGDKQPKMDSSGSSMPSWMGIEWNVDTDCGQDEIYILNKEDVKKFTLYNTRYDDTDGKILKYVSQADAFYAYSKSYNNLGGELPNTHVRYSDLAVPTF